jgi:D-glycero-D-manno-heptose 1,7-bisphosphate phosphatase
MTIKTIFLDRDGVINKEVNYLTKIEDFDFIDGVFNACKYFLNLGYKIIVITNQSGISRGYLSEKDYQKITSWMLSEFNSRNIDILDVLHCPHIPESKCNCRKPMPGMILQAKDIYDVDLKNSWMIGDKEGDIRAALNAGITNNILVKSGHKVNESSSKAKFILDSIIDSKKVITS